MKNPPAELVRFQADMKKHAGFVPFVKHTQMPVAMTIRGRASDTAEDGVRRVLECLVNPTFTAGWVVSKDVIIEVPVPA